MNVKKSTYEIPFFKVPFPPQLTVEEILSSRSEDKLKSRAPNRYLIYRLAFLKELRKRTDDNVSMTKISSHISSMWFNEPTTVRDAYKKLSEQVENRLTEIRQKEKLVLINESSSLDLQDNSPSGITEHNNVVSPRHIPILSDPSYQLCDSLYPLSLQRFPPYLHFPSEITENANPSYNSILFFDSSYQPFVPVDGFFGMNHYSIESCFCEACWNNFVNYEQS